MTIHTIKVSEEVNDFDKHYWVGMEASVTPEEDAVEQTKELRKKLEMVYSSDTKKVINKESEKPTLTPEETASLKSLVTKLGKFKTRSEAQDYLDKDKEWRFNQTAKAIVNSLPDKK